MRKANHFLLIVLACLPCTTHSGVYKHIDEHGALIENKISEEEKHLNEIKNEYKDGVPDRLGSERNYQRYLNRVERLKEEINVRENNLNVLKKELQNLPVKTKSR